MMQLKSFLWMRMCHTSIFHFFGKAVSQFVCALLDDCTVSIVLLCEQWPTLTDIKD